MAFVVYDPRAKKLCLGVPDKTLSNHNLTGEQAVLEMAWGALNNSKASQALWLPSHAYKRAHPPHCRGTKKEGIVAALDCWNNIWAL
jgi:hypothetical protein